MIGVYSLTNRINGKVYIGQSWNIETRFRDYKGYRSNSHLRAAFAKYGINNFHFGIVLAFPDDISQAVLDRAEDDYIKAGDRMNPVKGYNMRLGGSHGRHGEESKRLLAEVQRGRKLSEEHKRKIGAKSLGRYYSPETREKIGAAHRGLKMSEEVRKHLSDAHKGQKQSPEAIAKMLEWRKNNYRISEETRRKIGERVSAAKKGQPWSTKQRMAFEARRHR